MEPCGDDPKLTLKPKIASLLYYERNIWLKAVWTFNYKLTSFEGSVPSLSENQLRMGESSSWANPVVDVAFGIKAT